MLDNKDIQLREDELDNVSGGAKKIQYMTVACKFCTESFDVNIQKTRARCPNCTRINTFFG